MAIRFACPSCTERLTVQDRHAQKTARCSGCGALVPVPPCDYYEVLQVSPYADTEVIQAAYKRLAHKWHPDKRPGDMEAAEQMKLLNEAYEILSDPQKRTAYDRTRHQPEKEAGFGPEAPSAKSTQNAESAAAAPAAATPPGDVIRKATSHRAGALLLLGTALFLADRVIVRRVGANEVLLTVAIWMAFFAVLAAACYWVTRRSPVAFVTAFFAMAAAIDLAWGIYDYKTLRPRATERAAETFAEVRRRVMAEAPPVQRYPAGDARPHSPAPSFVRDRGKFFSVQAVSDANGRFGQLSRWPGMSILFETYDELTGEEAEKFKGITKAEQNDLFTKRAQRRATEADVHGIHFQLHRWPGNQPFLHIRVHRDSRYLLGKDRAQVFKQFGDELKREDFDAALLAAVTLAERTIAACPVRDGGKCFSVRALEEACERIRELTLAHGQTFVVETFAGLPPDDAKRYDGMAVGERWEYFSDWSRRQCDASGIRGLYMLVCREPKQVFLAISRSDEGPFTPSFRSRLLNAVRTDFRGDQFDSGLAAAVGLVADALDGGVQN